MVKVYRACCVASLVLLAACSGVPQAVAPAPAGVRAVPWQTLTGAPLAQVTAAGAPRNLAGPYTRLLAPTAVAARGNDVLVADPGLGRVVRFDLGMNVLSVLPEAAARPDTRLYLSPDGGAYVTDSARREVGRYDRGGKLTQRLRDDNLLALPVGIAVDERSGRIWIADGLSHQLLLFHPAGRAAVALPLRRGGEDGPRAVAALSAAQDGVWVVDKLCSCVFHLGDNGMVRATLGRGVLRQPVAVAADRRGRVYVLDRFDNRIVVFAGPRVVAHLAAPAGVAMDGIAVDGSLLYVASAAGARVDVLRLLDAPEAAP